MANAERPKGIRKGTVGEDEEGWGCVSIHPSIPQYFTDTHSIWLGDVGDIILYDSHLAVYKHSLDLILYFIAGPTENDLMISAALTSLTDALTMLLRNSLEKRGVLENLDLVLLCLDETIDDGLVLFLFLL